MLQKRQSSRCDGTDALRRECLRANVHELADGRIDEERGVVVAVAAAGTVDENPVAATELRLPAAA